MWLHISISTSNLGSSPVLSSLLLLILLPLLVDLVFLRLFLSQPMRFTFFFPSVLLPTGFASGSVLAAA